MRRLIYLSKDKNVARGCNSCRFKSDDDICIADPRVSVKKNGVLYDYRPYCCPFRYFDEGCPQILKRFEGMTEEETKGWFEGADAVYRKYCRLEDERDRYVESQQVKKHDD